MGLSQDGKRELCETTDPGLQTDRVYLVPSHEAKQRKSVRAGNPKAGNAQSGTQLYKTRSKSRDLPQKPVHSFHKLYGLPNRFACGEQNCHSNNQREKVKRTLSEFTDFIPVRENLESKRESDENASDWTIGFLMVTDYRAY
jgi:hypothetical protein